MIIKQPQYRRLTSPHPLPHPLILSDENDPIFALLSRPFLEPDLITMQYAACGILAADIKSKHDTKSMEIIHPHSCHNFKIQHKRE